jgi:hypothetical protein
MDPNQPQQPAPFWAWLPGTLTGQEVAVLVACPIPGCSGAISARVTNVMTHGAMKQPLLVTTFVGNLALFMWQQRRN